MELPKEKIKKLHDALAIGSPLKIALRYSGIAAATFYYWASIASVVAFCREQRELAKLSKSSDLMGIRKKAYAMASEDLDGNYVEPEPELVVKYQNSASFRKQADEIAEVVEKCREMETKVLLKHLSRISMDNSSKSQVDAAKWYLERALPAEFGRTEPEKPVSVRPLEVKFVKPSDDTAERIRKIESELAEGRNKA